MSHTAETPEEKVDELSARIRALERQLEAMTERTGSGEAAKTASPDSHPPATTSTLHSDEESPDFSEEVLSWVRRAALLPRLSTLCFMLVVALILRTITDSGLIARSAGVSLGMFYAAGLIAFGYYKYGRSSPLAPVLTACGALLMPVIVVETHTHFQSLPLVPAYLALIGTGIGTAYISRRFNVFTPISVGILGMALGGAAIDYPHPYFPYLCMVLITANVMGYYAAGLKQCSWLRWTTLVVTMLMLLLWGLRLGQGLSQGETPTPDLAVAWFLPVLTVFALTFPVLGLLGIIRSKSSKTSRFDLMLPILNAAWAFTVAYHAIEAPGKRIVGIIGIIAAIAHLALSFWLARRNVMGAPGTGSFAFAGGILLALALPAATGMFTLSLAAISLVAIFLAVMSRVWKNGGVRLCTYLFHIYSCTALVIMLRGEGAAATDLINILPAGLLAIVILYQYQWCRRNPPPAGHIFFSSIDDKDRSAALLLVAALLCGYYAMRIGMYHGVHLLAADARHEAFRCGESVLINLSAAGLMLFAYLRANREIRNIAVLVTITGGLKVFLSDLIGAHGLPLVLSVFSFGLTAAIESVALGKWPKHAVEREEEPELPSQAAVPLVSSSEGMG
ncbi:DUF2339 domain-containing protein [Geobacter sp. SVR]|uniref:DUF2339 domain-containing protein n=1 Tax=Geobacter sp. SVR TaxID=2495594 RepID=UPI00143EFC7A|nr:DUF2339 domain-containing protein [Geobacter sp. SVR]BCS56006.1 hypothetical protein GSVR_43140 [Geobacter sp. SVR]GCF84769.1 hypothetical protein GSbR_13690 [Geobacter sp. SVR]